MFGTPRYKVKNCREGVEGGGGELILFCIENWNQNNLTISEEK